MFLIRLLHLTIFGFSGMLPLLGVATVFPAVSIMDIALLLLVALVFHNFAYLLNDVVDLPIDRTQPTRADYPLVRGPMNRGVEIDAELADDVERSVIREQVEMGVAVRMACMDLLARGQASGAGEPE